MSEIHPSAKIADSVIIGDNVVIEEDVFIDHGCILRDHIRVGKGSRIGAYSILGEYQADFYKTLTPSVHPLVIGEGSLIRSGAILYGGSTFGPFFQTGHRVTIREGTQIGEHCRVGTLCDIQGDCVVGDYVNMHSNVHIGMKSVIHNYVWIFPYVVLTNDPTPPSPVLCGVTIEEFAVISTGSIILPGVRIGKDALIGAAANVTKDVPAEQIAVGNPAKLMGSIDKVVNKKTGERVYPWRFTFRRGMPWENVGYEDWAAKIQASEVAR